MPKLFLLFTVVPLVELYLLLRLSRAVGFGTTFAIVVVTGLLGALLARAEGLRVLRAWQAALAAGRLPEDGVVSGLLVLVGGVLLVTPGVITDVCGFLLLLPPTRRAIAGLITRRLARGFADGSVTVIGGYGPRSGSPFGPPSGPPPASHRSDPYGPRPSPVIDTEGEPVEPPPRPR